MPATYTLIASNTLSSSAASVTFSSIPATYTDLVLRLSGRINVSAWSSTLTIKFNSSSATNYSRTDVRADSSTVSSTRTSAATSMVMRSVINGLDQADTWSSVELYIPNYAGSTNKPISGFGASEANDASAGTVYKTIMAGLFSDTTAISSIELSSSQDFVSGSSFFLYGIKSTA